MHLNVLNFDVLKQNSFVFFFGINFCRWHGFDHGDHGLVGLPYNMEYALPSHNYHTTAELNGGDLFSMPLQQAAHDALSVQPAAAHTFTSEAIAPSESQLSPVVASLTAQQKSHLQPMMGNIQTAKVKRQDDIWTGDDSFSKYQ